MLTHSLTHAIMAYLVCLRSRVDVKKDRERTRGTQQQQQSASSQQQQQASGDRSRGGGGTQIPRPQAGGGQGMPPGSYRDANGIPRSLAVDQPIVASSYKPSMEDGGAYGTSYTNRKTKEYDLLNDIVKQTRNNFIDVSAKSGQLDEDDLLERGQKYVKNLSEIPSNSMQTIAPSATSHSFGVYYNAMELPSPSSHVVKRTSVPSSASSSSLSSGLAQSKMTGEIDYAALVNILSSASVPPHDIDFITTASTQIASVILESTTIQDPPPRIVLTFEELLNDK
jgi:hypothetical protein